MCASVFAVHKSKCPGYIGITGIVVQETQNTFKLICKDNRVRSKLSFQLPITAFTAHVHIALAYSSSLETEYVFSTAIARSGIRTHTFIRRPEDSIECKSGALELLVIRC